jgi:hypothetical protein
LLNNNRLGFVLSFEIKTIDGLVEFETYFRLSYRERSVSFDNIISKVEVNNSIFQFNLIKFEFNFVLLHKVSTDLSLAEVRSKNYASILDQHDNPFLLINFNENIGKEIILAKYWHDPKSNLMFLNKYQNLKL